MNSLNGASRPRAVAVWTLSTVTLAALLRWLAGDLSRPSSNVTFDVAIVQLCAVVAVACALWAWTVTTVVVVEVLRRSPRTSTGVPTWARAVVLMACGVAAVNASIPAGAVSADIDLDGLPMPDRASGGFLAETVRPQLQASAPPPVPHPTTNAAHGSDHVVSAGESLWSIADEELGDPRRWVEIYRLNHRLIGPEPDLIDPAQRLDLPPHR